MFPYTKMISPTGRAFKVCVIFQVSEQKSFPSFIYQSFESSKDKVMNKKKTIKSIMYYLNSLRKLNLILVVSVRFLGVVSLKVKICFCQKKSFFSLFFLRFFCLFFLCLFFCLRKTTLTVNRQLSEHKNGAIRFCQCLDCLAPSITFLSTNGRKREEILTIRQLKSSYR